MTLNEFMKELRADLQEFELMWTSAEPRENYPSDLTEEDWYEQFLSFQQTSGNLSG